MLRQANSALKLSAFVLALLAGAFAGKAQSPPAAVEKEQAKSPGVISTHFLRAGLYYFDGGGGNSILRLSGEGLVLVDGKTAKNYEELRSRINKLSRLPIRVVVNTGPDPQHTGTNAKFIADRTPVLGQQDEKRVLEAYPVSGETIAPPSNTYDHDQVLHLGPVEVRLLHPGHARTSADTVVYFPDKQVVALGDTYAPMPNPDYAAGGSLVGWSKVLGEVLKLDFNVAVPGAGATVSRAEVEAFKAKVDTLISRAAQLVNQGVPKSQFLDRLKTEDLGWKLSYTPEQVAGVYAELSKS